MTYQQDCTLPEELLEQIATDGLEALPGLIRILVNEAMRLEREQHLGAGAYERTPTRRGYANGYKPKTMKTRLGEIEFSVPQAREGDFYPDALSHRSAPTHPYKRGARASGGQRDGLSGTQRRR
ncbi:MAG: hypothetical protein FVQ83_11390 [Chloroflexi bacterium]|nr:hypothetical protein [Chloroflexota bacterium]